MPRDIPLDPWEREYQYRRDADGKAEVLSFGPNSAQLFAHRSQDVSGHIGQEMIGEFWGK